MSSAATEWAWPLALGKVDEKEDVEVEEEEEDVEAFAAAAAFFSSSSPLPPASAHATSSSHVSSVVEDGGRTFGADQQRSQSVARTKREEEEEEAVEGRAAVATSSWLPMMPSRPRVTTTNRPSGNVLSVNLTCAHVQFIFEQNRKREKERAEEEDERWSRWVPPLVLPSLFFFGCVDWMKKATGEKN